MDTTYNLNGGFKPTMKRFADLDGPDFFPTPAWATHALVDNEVFRGDIWESACGNGAMSDVLKTTGNTVISSDLFDRGYGDAGVDFLNGHRRRTANIVTNPPYGERLEDEETVSNLYMGIPGVMRHVPSWSLFLITSFPQFEEIVQKEADRRRKLYNGRIQCTYYQYLGPRPPRGHFPERQKP